MTKTNIRRSSRIARRTVNQGAFPVVPVHAAVNENSTTELANKTNLLKCKRLTNISTFNVRTLNSITQIAELVSSAISINIDVICIQEHRYYHEGLNLSIMKLENTGDLHLHLRLHLHLPTIAGIGILLSPRAMKSLRDRSKFMGIRGRPIGKYRLKISLHPV